jgi:hypothetical protein
MKNDNLGGESINGEISQNRFISGDTIGSNLFRRVIYISNLQPLSKSPEVNYLH